MVTKPGRVQEAVSGAARTVAQQIARPAAMAGCAILAKPKAEALPIGLAGRAAIGQGGQRLAHPGKREAQLLRDQAQRLVIADGGDGEAGALRQIADGKALLCHAALFA